MGAALDRSVELHRALGGTLQAETFDQRRITAAFNMNDGRMYGTRIWVPQPMTLTGFRWYQGTNGNFVSDNNNKIGLYSVSGTDLVAVAVTADDANLWKQGGTAINQKALAAPVDIAAGAYFVLALYNSSSQTTAPTIGQKPTTFGGFASGALLRTDLYLSFFKNSQTDLGSTIALSGCSGNTVYQWFGLY